MTGSPQPNTAQSLLSFMIGSPQAFIEAARTLRDLWAGSYLVSWLTAHAIRTLYVEPGVEFVTPAVDPQSNGLLDAVLRGGKGNDLATLPSVPNKFCALVPSDRAQELADACVRAARAEWSRLAGLVRAELDKTFLQLDPAWSCDWDDQVESFFEFASVVTPLTGDDAASWNRDWDQLGKLLEMTRSVRHVPGYRSRREIVPPKCSLLGTYEQMGPGGLRESRAFWEKVSDWKGHHGTRLQKSDRLCAVSLVKRFAWPMALADQLGLQAAHLRFSDTATIAAASWLRLAEIDPEKERHKHGHWSGQWLHWNTASQDVDEEPCPEPLFETIQSRRAPKSCGPPPLYYAILHLDGDNMGDLFRSADGGVAGRARYQDVTGRLTGFAATVREIVKDHDGELIYCGGDDVLALLPTARAMECAAGLNAAFKAQMQGGSLSGGVAVVHFKEDLRYALKVVRRAEKVAKGVDARRAGAGTRRKDAVAVAVCRHSGEHSLFTLPTECMALFHGLVDAFLGGASDRWAYKFRQLLPSYQALPPEAAKLELERLLNRMETEGSPAAVTLRTTVPQVWTAYAGVLSGLGWKHAGILDQFVTLCQSASFLSRGRD